MKNLITILLLIITVTSYGQSELELKIFKYFNEYRIEKGLNPLKFDKKVLLATEHHTKYLNDNGYPYNYILDNPHREKELVHINDRLKKYGTTILFNSGECIVMISRGYKQTDDDMLRDAIKWWDRSPSHKTIMCLENVDIGAISILKVKDEGGYDAFLMTLNVVNVRD